MAKRRKRGVPDDDDENVRLRPFPSHDLKRGDMRIKVDLGSYGITFLALEKRN